MSQPATTPVAGAPLLPHAVAIAWGVAELPQRGPKRELSTERIVDAAIVIADADGLDAVSMGRVATALGFTPMSLYRYVTGKDDLLLLMVDAASEIQTPPSDGDWRTRVRTWATYVRAGYQAHPWLSSMPPSATPTTPNRLAILDGAVGAMSDLRLPDDAKVSIALLLMGYIGLFGEAGHETEVDADVRAALRELVTTDRFPNLADAVHAGIFDEPLTGRDRAFFFGLNRLLDGVQAWLESGGRDDAAIDRIPPAVVRDRKVKDAMKAVREAEARLAEARREAQKVAERAIEREAAAEERAREREARAQEKAEAKARKRA
ncbi:MULTISPECIES: TetR/AcrR family transcriptional regulator [unclassified Agrococcus]|uniref:TetR/AcrR family transcriptional regulator n=1 Tax=unclassified Agrococcus TaxID=2615065 RepID=UPI00360D198F